MTTLQNKKYMRMQEKEKTQSELDAALRRDHFDKVKKIITQKEKLGEKFGPAQSYRKNIIRPIAESWWSAHKVKSFSNRIYLDRLKQNLQMGDSAYIKNAMLLNALGESHEQQHILHTQSNISLNQQSSELMGQETNQATEIDICDQQISDRLQTRSKSLMNLQRKKQSNRVSRVQLPQPDEGHLNRVIKLEAIFNHKTPDNLPSTQLNQSRSIGETTLQTNNLTKMDEGQLMVDINTDGGMQMFNQEQPGISMENTIRSLKTSQRVSPTHNVPDHEPIDCNQFELASSAEVIHVPPMPDYIQHGVKNLRHMRRQQKSKKSQNLRQSYSLKEGTEARFVKSRSNFGRARFVSSKFI